MPMRHRPFGVNDYTEMCKNFFSQLPRIYSSIRSSSTKFLGTPDQIYHCPKTRWHKSETDNRWAKSNFEGCNDFVIGIIATCLSQRAAPSFIK